MIRQDGKHLDKLRAASASEHSLNEREQHILRSVVLSFIETADPVGSRFLSKQFLPRLSAATIRNTMSDLEDLGYLNHPYTSAGRIPTELGYRMYVDTLMESVQLSSAEKLLIREEVGASSNDPERLLRETAKLMGRLSNLLAIALTPRISKGLLHRIEVVLLSSSRAMFVLSVEGGLVKTIIMEVESELNRQELDRVVQMLNERLAGLTLEESRRSFGHRLKDLSESDPTGMVRLVMQQGEHLFSELSEENRVHFGGATQIVSQPEFREPEQVQKIFNFLENEEVVVQLLENQGNWGQQSTIRGAQDDITRIRPIKITIGSENKIAETYSLVTANYRVRDAIGTISLVGPMRMNYARAVALIDYVSKLLSS
jgi:heat-inducible transcriptional repressor